MSTILIYFEAIQNELKRLEDNIDKYSKLSIFGSLNEEIKKELKNEL